MVKNKNVDTRGPNGLGQTRPGPTSPAQPSLWAEIFENKNHGLGWADLILRWAPMGHYGLSM
jgi:hypothetical protein